MSPWKFIPVGAAFCALTAPQAGSAPAQTREFAAKQVRFIIGFGLAWESD